MIKEEMPWFWNDDEEVKSPAQKLMKNCFIYWALWIIIIIIACVVATVIISTHQVVQTFLVEKDPVPFRVVDHGVWPGYRLEFFDVRVPFVTAERICRSRNNSRLLTFADQEQENKFDLYVGTNFWDEKSYAQLQFWTGGRILIRKGLNDYPPKIIWPEKDPTRPKELAKLRPCAQWSRGLGQVNAYQTKVLYWSEAHIIKDYQSDHLLENGQIVDPNLIAGCWQMVKREDFVDETNVHMPRQLHRFVCQKKIS